LRGSSAFGRVAALIALGVAVVVVVLMLTGGGSQSYEVTGEFENASQLVPGNEVVVGGVAAGSVKEIELGDDGQALVSFTVDPEFAPLERGTVATVRSYSLSGIANRQVQLTMPPEGEGGAEIPPGGTLTQSETVSEVDLDEIFNTLDPETVEDFKHVIQGFEISYDGVGEQANRGFKYLNPFLSTSRRLFSELTYDRQALEDLIVDGSKLSGALAERAPDISALIGNLDVMMNAIGRQKLALADAISKFPGFMRDANTTFVNLRAALDDVDPLVDASKPAAKELQRFLPELRAATADAVPTIRDLDAIVRRSGNDNDLVELTRLQVPLARAAIGSGSPDCGDPQQPEPADGAGDGDFTQGAFGESRCALLNGNPTLANFRAYTPELVGWFDGFSHPGYIDALGGIGRVSTSFNQFTVSDSTPLLNNPVTAETFYNDFVQTDLDERCPGTNERVVPGNLSPNGGVPYDPADVTCDPGDLMDQP
jgi:phospholipid/cholesterol/gamma-HCH transport system substrate-binding protein